jgi:TonB-dependent receptor
LVPGVRFEKNRTEYTGYRGNRLGVLRDWQRTPIDTVTKVRNNEFVLPMIQLFYKPTDWMTIKAGYTHTLQRPNFNNIMPGWVINNQGGISNLSNFRLKPELSRNVDLQFSFHSDKIGLFSVGAFYKKITDMIFWTGQRAITDTAFYELPTIMFRQRAATAVNNPNDAINYGYELEWQSNFWFLPGLLKGLVVNVNYTRNRSEADYLRTVIKLQVDPITYQTTLVNEDTTYTSRMISQPDHLLNLTLGYDYKGFSIRWAMRYTSGIFKAPNWYESLRGFSTDFIRYDLSLRQKLPVEGMEVFLNVNNLTGEIEQDVINHMSFSRYMEDYGRTANIGVRYQF